MTRKNVCTCSIQIQFKKYNFDGRVVEVTLVDPVDMEADYSFLLLALFVYRTLINEGQVSGDEICH
jgi:hypothetical protein